MDLQAINYTPHPSAITIHDSPTKIKAVCGPVGSGKTSVGCWEFWLLCWESTISVRGVVIRSSYRELHDSTRKTFEEWFGAILTYREKDEEATITFPGRDGVVRSHSLLFRACKREAEASKFLSTEYSFIWLEECVPAFTSTRAGGVMGQGLPYGIFQMARMRLRQKGAHRLEILLTFNPPSTRHWTYREFFQATPEDFARKGYSFFRQPPGENKRHLPPHYYEDLLEGLSPDMARRFVGGEVVAIYEGERVFPECQDGIHIVDFVEPVPGAPLIVGVDYGLTPCAVVTQILPGGQWLIVGELQLFNRGVRAYIETLGPWLKTEFPRHAVSTVWQDPTGGNQRSQVDETETCGILMRQAGYTVQDGNNNWSLRRELMKQRFEWFPGGRPGVLVSRQHCPLIVEGLLGGYRYPTTAAGITGSSPIKNEWSHSQDCLQMIATGEFSLVSGLVNKEDLAVKKLIRQGYNPLQSTGRPTFARANWMRR
jgi:hypothetical protein